MLQPGTEILGVGRQLLGASLPLLRAGLLAPDVRGRALDVGRQAITGGADTFGLGFGFGGGLLPPAERIGAFGVPALPGVGIGARLRQPLFELGDLAARSRVSFVS